MTVLSKTFLQGVRRRSAETTNVRCLRRQSNLLARRDMSIDFTEDFDCVDGSLNSRSTLSQLQEDSTSSSIVVISSPTGNCSSDDFSDGNSLLSSQSIFSTTPSKSKVCESAPFVEESWDLTSAELSSVTSTSSSATNSPLVRELVELSNAPYDESTFSSFALCLDGDMKLKGSL